MDTSAFYAYASREDQDHEAVVDAFRTCLEGEHGFVATSYVVAETMGLIQHRLGRATVELFVTDILPLVDVRWVGATEHAAARRLLRDVGRRSFNIVDASSGALMQRDGASRIVALDPEFARLGFTVVPAASRRPPGRRARA